MKLLLLNMNFIGDSLFTTPAIAAIRARYQDAFLVNVVHPRSREVFQNSPHLNLILERPLGGASEKLAFIRRLRRERFDMAVLFSRSSAELSIMGRMVAPRLLGLDNPRIAPFLTDKVPEKPYRHMVDDRLDIALALGARVDEPRLEIFLNEEDEVRAIRFLERSGWVIGDPLVGICPGASTPIKRWPVERFAVVAREVAHRFHARPLIIGGPGDLESAEAIAEMAGVDSISAAGVGGIGFSSALIARCAAFVSGDTGPLHLATAVRTPVVGIYGPTNPVRTGPYGGRSVVLQGQMPDQVPSVEAVSATQVVEALEVLLKSAATPACSQGGR